MMLFVNYPSWIHPEIFPGVPVLGLIRWYGLMYIFAFSTAFLVLKRLLKEGALDTPQEKATEDDVFGFIATGIVFLLVGARVFSTLVNRNNQVARYNARAESRRVLNGGSDFHIGGFVGRGLIRLGNRKSHAAEFAFGRVAQAAHRARVQIERVRILKRFEHSFERATVQHRRIDLIDVVFLNEIKNSVHHFHILPGFPRRILGRLCRRLREALRRKKRDKQKYKDEITGP